MQVTAPPGETFVKFGKFSNAAVVLSIDLKALHPIYRDYTDCRKEKMNSLGRVLTVEGTLAQRE